MTTKKAVKILEEQVLKLEQSKSEALLLQTQSFIKDFSEKTLMSIKYLKI